MLPCWWSIFRYQSPTCSAYKPDFISFYTGATLMWSDPTSLYDLEKQRLVQEAIDPTRGSWVLPFFYPPFFALTLVPLAWLSFSAAFATMTLVNAGLLAATMRILIRELQLGRQQTSWLVLSTFCSYGIQYAFLEAQTSFLALMLLVLFVLAVRRSAIKEAGIWSGLLCFKPQLAVTSFLILIGKKDWRAIVMMSAVIAALGTLSLIAVGTDGLVAYLEVSRRAAVGDEYLHVQPEGMHNLRALTHFFVPQPWRDVVWWSGTIGLGALILAETSMARKSNGVALIPWDIVLFCLILMTPHLHTHDLTLLAVPAAFALKQAGDAVPAKLAAELVMLGVFPLINTVAYPYLPPLVPIALLTIVIARFLRRSGGAHIYGIQSDKRSR